jgi:hypothetical protein
MYSVNKPRLYSVSDRAQLYVQLDLHEFDDVTMYGLRGGLFTREWDRRSVQ